MAKLTLLMIVIFISSVLILCFMTNYLTSACLSMDNLMNSVCTLLMFKHNEKYFDALCCGCNRLCVRLCLFCCTQRRYKMEEEEEKKDDAEQIRVELKVKTSSKGVEESDGDCDDSDLERMWKGEDNEFDTLAVIFLNEDSVNHHQFDASRVPTFV